MTAFRSLGYLSSTKQVWNLQYRNWNAEKPDYDTAMKFQQLLPHCQLIYIHSYTNCMVLPQDCKMLKEKHNRLASCWPRKLSRCMLISMSLKKRDLMSNLMFYSEHLKNEAEHITISTQISSISSKQNTYWLLALVFVLL